ncbi:Histone-lysine N-methyltransferase [Acanthamoeba castellanii str. Neff]|uniref:Histone-lysine N-methyltransferase n=1 Tax=Acanthamoeba castellanii (strain ATCC 30010 / Neff) TaxID=1257118 RepID=L8H8P8_ACACF|nr:Histone-lysine N-methyltransferase [Acanthamoeba castellanii str. Neff]ELR21550.1 Histone-lysine N-methyltransferase [Acanthamoeba castellanii str. Neff]
MDSFCHRPWLEVITAARQSRKAAAHDHGDDGDDEDEDDEDDDERCYSNCSTSTATTTVASCDGDGDAATTHTTLTTPGQGKGPLAELFTPDFYSHLLGLLEMNQNAIRIVSPLQTYATLLHDHLFPSEAQAQETALGELGNGELPSFTDAHTTQNTWERLNAMSELLTLVEQIQGDDDECDDDDEDEDADGGSGHHHAHDKKAKAKHHEDSEEDEGDRKGKGKSKAERGSDSEAETAEEEDDNKPVELFPPFEGFGLFPIAAMMNHSCEPNTQVKFGRNREAVVVALCDIAEGEELTHSYIENDRPLAERQADLLEYNFVCQCVRCLKETTVA